MGARARRGRGSTAPPLVSRGGAHSASSISCREALVGGGELRPRAGSCSAAWVVLERLPHQQPSSPPRQDRRVQDLLLHRGVPAHCSRASPGFVISAGCRRPPAPGEERRQVAVVLGQEGQGSCRPLPQWPVLHCGQTSSVTARHGGRGRSAPADAGRRLRHRYSAPDLEATVGRHRADEPGATCPPPDAAEHSRTCSAPDRGWPPGVGLHEGQKAGESWPGGRPRR